MQKIKFKNQSGQAGLEACLILTVMICFFGLLFLGITVFSLRMKINAVTEDFASCYFGQKSSWQCQLQAKTNCLKLLEEGGLTNAIIQTWYQDPFAFVRIEANWGKIRIHWNFKQQSPLEASLFK